MAKLKRVAAINDISGFGRCSLTVAIPVISALGLQVCPMPTAVLSAHTGFEHYSFCDLTENMEEYVNKWAALGLSFDTVYSGFLGSEAQIDIVSRFAKSQKDSLFLVDPVMGDEGLIYKTYTPEMCRSMKRLCSGADIITPNLTEACILLDEPYPKGEMAVEEIEKMVLALGKTGAGNVIITGIPHKNKFINAVYTKRGISLFENVHIDIDINGSGDLFASLICAYATKGLSLEAAVEKAGAFVTEAIAYTRKNNYNPEHGIVFEPLLKKEMIP